MYADEFEVRLARVRHRFATSLENKISNTMMYADRMSRSDKGVVKYVADSYRYLHSICGVGATVGFIATGEAARHAEAALMPAFQEKRGLSEAEVSILKTALGKLQAAAASELQMMYQRGG